jgi:hypothetical protein
MSKLTERLRAYSQRRKIARGLDVEHIHTFDACPEGGINLLLSDVDGALDRIEHLERVLVQAQKDAERYRWLREFYSPECSGRYMTDIDRAWYGDGPDLDAAIDEALKEKT